MHIWKHRKNSTYHLKWKCDLRHGQGVSCMWHLQVAIETQLAASLRKTKPECLYLPVAVLKYINDLCFVWWYHRVFNYSCHFAQNSLQLLIEQVFISEHRTCAVRTWTDVYSPTSYTSWVTVNWNSIHTIQLQGFCKCQKKVFYSFFFCHCDFLCQFDLFAYSCKFVKF